MNYCRETGDNSDGKFRRQNRRRINCSLLLWASYFSIQIDGQRKTWRSHIFLEEKGPYTASYFPYSLFPFIDFLIDFYLIQLVCIKYIQIRRGTWHYYNYMQKMYPFYFPKKKIKLVNIVLVNMFCLKE